MNVSMEKVDFDHVKSDLYELLVLVVNVRLWVLMLWKHLQRYSGFMKVSYNLALQDLTMLIIHIRQ